MTACAVCGNGDGLSFVCKLCGGNHCPDHQLPENHDCLGLETYDADASWFHTEEATVEAGTDEANWYRQEAPVALEKSDLGHLPGTRPDPDFSTGPDVAADGSVISSTAPGAPDPPDSPNLGRRLRWVVGGHLERYRNRPSSFLVDVVYIGIVCAIVATAYFVATRFLL